jgi:hypothetical protein
MIIRDLEYQIERRAEELVFQIGLAEQQKGIVEMATLGDECLDSGGRSGKLGCMARRLER